MSKKPSVFYGAPVEPPKQEKQLNYEKTLVKAFTIVYNTKSKEYELITINLDLKEDTAEFEMSKIRGADNQARAMYELQKVTNEYFIKGKK